MHECPLPQPQPYHSSARATSGCSRSRRPEKHKSVTLQQCQPAKTDTISLQKQAGRSETHLTVFRLFMNDIPVSTDTFPLKKYFPWPLERATPTLEETGDTERETDWTSEPTGYLLSNTWTDSRSRIAVRAPPEWCPFNVGVVIVVVHLQNPPLKEKKKNRRQGLIGEGGTGHAYLQPHPSVHGLLHLHGESACSPVHHGIAQLKHKTHPGTLGSSSQ